MQKAFNYRSEPVGTVFDPKGNDYTLKNPSPATPVWLVPVGKVGPVSSGGGLRQATNYSFTIHGVLCLEHRFRPSRGKVPIVASELAITCGTLRTFEFTPAHAGDHAYRRGVLKWAVHEYIDTRRLDFLMGRRIPGIERLIGTANSTGESTATPRSPSYTSRCH